MLSYCSRDMKFLVSTDQVTSMYISPIVLGSGTTFLLTVHK